MASGSSPIRESSESNTAVVSQGNQAQETWGKIGSRWSMAREAQSQSLIGTVGDRVLDKRCEDFNSGNKAIGRKAASPSEVRQKMERIFAQTPPNETRAA